MYRSYVILAAVLGSALATGPAWADGGANHQVSSNEYGVSGGNVNDISRAFCCSGTIGSLLRDSRGVLHMLSNNHVFARSGSGKVGEDITQPGLIDNGCRPSEIVGDLDAYPPLGNNVDAATATLRTGAMRSDGFIMDVGQVSGLNSNPTVGLAVAKSGRTTGLTTGTIQSLNTSVSIQYQRGCGSGKKFRINYTNQIVTTPGMIAGGDSGSLLVDGACHAVGLLYAGGADGTAIGNPASEVLSKVRGALGDPSASFVTGNTCLLAATAGGTASRPGPSQGSIGYATAVMQEHLSELMRGNVIGMGVGAADDNPSEAVLVIYIDRTQGVVPQLPEQVRGLRVKRVFTDPFVALPACGSCGDSGKTRRCN